MVDSRVNKKVFLVICVFHECTAYVGRIKNYFFVFK